MSDIDTPIIGFGKEIGYSDTADGTFVKVNKTMSITLPESELGKADATNDDSPDFTKENIPTLYDPGTMKVKYEYTAAQYAILHGIYLLATVAATRASAVKFWKVTLPDGSTGLAKGFITKHPLPLEMEDVVSVEMEIQCSGKMTFTAGTTGGE